VIEMLKKIRDFISTIILIAMIMLAVLLAGPYLIGLRTYAVISGSMEPTLNVGSLAYVKPAEPEEISQGDIITFFMDGSQTAATHRVVKINTEEKTFITKGDANNCEDAPVSFDRLVGKTLFDIPYLGYLTMYIKTKQGIISAVCILTLMVLFSCISRIMRKEKHQQSESKPII
jgi:signal peptidase